MSGLAAAALRDVGGSAGAPGRGGMTLGRLLAGIGGEHRLVHGEPETWIAGLSCDSRRVAPGDLFVALHGERLDGAEFVAQARARGAAAVAIAEQRVGRIELDARCPLVACAVPRELVADAAAELAGHPSRALTMVAVTGTSGKTTTSYLLEAIFTAAGRTAGVVGTIEYRFAGHHEAAALTTPDAIELQALLARMRAEGTSHVAMEASSHALALDRLRCTALDAAVFTNFSRDHLDYHGDMEHYFAAKARLFRELLPASGKSSFAVLAADDPQVLSLRGELSVPVVTFGERGDVRCEGLVADRTGLRGTLLLGTQSVPLHSRLIGAPHLANILAAAATAWRLGMSPAAISAGIERCAAVPGRLETVHAGQPFDVVVDYAHKPDALECTLSSLRTLTRGRLIVVFGCGGDRDAGKRPLMGAIAARLADLTIVTSDNPRTEDPMAIISAIEEGVRREGRTPVAQEALGQTGHEVGYVVVPERRAAVRRAIEVAQAGDVVMIAGKGHEDYQIVGTAKHHLDDREEARAALAARGYEGAQRAGSR